MENETESVSQAEIFGEGICTVCGQDVEPTLHKGKLATLLWCSSACTQSYAVTKVMANIGLVRLDAIKPLNSQSMNNHDTVFFDCLVLAMISDYPGYQGTP